MKRAEHQPETVSTKIYAGIYYRVWHVPDADTIIPQHSHRFPHLTALLSGSVAVSRDGGQPDVYDAPATIEESRRAASMRFARWCRAACWRASTTPTGWTRTASRPLPMSTI